MGFEHGPFLAQQNGTLAMNPLSWNSAPATMVYIEQPAGVGFSYSSNPDDYTGAYNDTVAASDNAAFLSAFFTYYPQYSSLPLYLTGESYGGNYVPQWAAAVLEGSDTRLKEQLKGFMINNPGEGKASCDEGIEIEDGAGAWCPLSTAPPFLRLASSLLNRQLNPQLSRHQERCDC
jgi:hypothetical protein